MAVTCTKLPCVVRHLSFSITWLNPIIVGVKTIGSESLGRRKASLLRIRSSVHNKVFEDQSEGIVCYVDNAGDAVCKGYDDERPRFRWEVTNHHASSRYREARIIGLLQRKWIQLVDARDVYLTDEVAGSGSELAAREEFSQNGCNFN